MSVKSDEVRCPRCLRVVKVGADDGLYPTHDAHSNLRRVCEHSGEPLRYYRNKLGTMVHHEGCPTRGDVPWDYSAGKSLEHIRKTIAHFPWLRACKKCLP